MERGKTEKFDQKIQKIIKSKDSSFLEKKNLLLKKMYAVLL